MKTGKENPKWYSRILMPTATRKAQLAKSKDAVAGLRINHGGCSRSSLTTVLPVVTFNIIPLHRNRKKCIFVVAVVYLLKSTFFCLIERMLCLMYYFYSPVRQPSEPTATGSSCLAFSFLPSCPSWYYISPLHVQILRWGSWGTSPSSPSPTFRIKKVIVICGSKLWYIQVNGTSLLGPSALLLPHRQVRCRLHLLGVLIIMAHPFTEELILASI